MDQLLSAGAAMGGLYLLLLFGACLGGVAGFRLYALRRREERERALREEWERERESAESAAPPPPPNSAPKTCTTSWKRSGRAPARNTPSRGR